MTGIYEQLEPLFHPRSIAVVGVSQDLWKSGSVMVRALQRFGFSGPIFAVGSRGGSLLGLEVHRSLLDVPGHIDLALVFVPLGAMLQTLRDCRGKGVRAAIAFTGGLSESGTEAGKALEEQIVAELDGSLRLVGPNCLGLYCPAGGVTQHPGATYPRESGEVSFIAQSGGFTEDFARAAPNFGFHASKVLSYGNAVDLNEADLLEYFEADPETAIIGIYIEGARNGRKLLEVMRRLKNKKPVVVWKGGLTPKGAEAASSHTGSLAGSVEVWKAALRQAGAVQVNSQEEQLDVLSAFHFLPGHSDARVAYVCQGGGNSVAAGDASFRAGLVLPHLSAETENKIAAHLPPVGASTVNPIDVQAPIPSAQALKSILEAVATSGEVGAIILDKIVMSVGLRRLMGYTDQIPEQDEEWLSEIPVQIVRETGTPVVVVLRENLDPSSGFEIEQERLRLRRYYQENDLAVYPTLERAFHALGRVVAYYGRGETV